MTKTLPRAHAARSRFQVVLNTCPDAATAERIATALVRERLAACVNIVPLARSVYRWRGQIESSAEWLLLIKSKASAARALHRRLREMHPYEIPEILALPVIGGLSDYLRWLGNPDGVP